MSVPFTFNGALTTNSTTSNMEALEEHQNRQRQLAAVREYEYLISHNMRKPTPILRLRVSIKEDSEYCFEGCSRLHRLACGHVVHTYEPSVCGENCKTPKSNYMPFICVICGRWKMVQCGQASRRTSHIADLVLPDFPSVKYAHTPLVARPRECDLVYVLPEDHVFVFHSMEDVAIVRLKDQARLVQLIYKTIPEVSGRSGWQDAVEQAACENMVLCVNHQHLWVAKTYEELAVLSMYVASVRAKTNKVGKLSTLASSFDVDEAELRELLPRVMNLVIDNDARTAIASFVPKFVKLLPQLDWASKKIASMVLKIWTMVLKDPPFASDLLVEHWIRLIGSCVFTILLANDINLSATTICAALGVDHHGAMGNNFDVDVVRMIVGDNTYSLWDQDIKGRRHRKLKVRKERQATGNHQKVSPSHAYLDILIAAAQGPSLTAILEHDFAKSRSNEMFEERRAKRRRLSITDEDRMEI